MLKNIEKFGKLPCAFCQGKGTQPGSGSLSCIVCRGSGQVRTKQPYKLCKECGGRGRKKGASLYCLLCQGKGFVEGRRYLSPAESSVSKTRSSDAPMGSEFRPQRWKKKSRKRRKDKFRKRRPIRKSRKKVRSIKSTKPKVRKSFFKELLRTFKIL